MSEATDSFGLECCIDYRPYPVLNYVSKANFQILGPYQLSPVSVVCNRQNKFGTVSTGSFSLVCLISGVEKGMHY